MRAAKSTVQVGAAALALGLSLAGPGVGVAAADEDISAPSATAGRSAAPSVPPRRTVRPNRGDSANADTAAVRVNPTAAATASEPRNRPVPAGRRPAGHQPTIAPASSTAAPPAKAVTVPRTIRSCGSCAAFGAATPAQAMPSQTLAPAVVPVAQMLDDAGNRLSTLPAQPFNEFLSGALLIARRSLLPESPSAAATAVGTGKLFTGVKDWITTFVNLYPWWSGSLLPRPAQKLFFHATLVATPMQVELDLGKGVTSQAIPFTAYDPDGNALRYSVAAQGTPGGPGHGTVVVDSKAGTFTYTPDENFTGTDTFAFVADDRTTPHVHAWENLINGAFGLFNTSLAGGHRGTATVTVFNNVDIRPNPDVPVYTDITGDFSFLTYNVAGTPGLSKIAKTLDISSRLTGFDVVNVQDDVSYHPFLVAKTTFPDRTAPSVPTWTWSAGLPFSDGLNSFSSYYVESLDRQSWTTRPDLLTPGGFTYSREHIPGGSSVDVYNVDAAAGKLTNDEIAQLSTFIAQNSVGRAVIVSGDFAQFYSDAGQTLTTFAAANGLTDAWVQLEYGGTVPTNAPKCSYDNNCEQPDKIFYRDAAPLNPLDPASNPVDLQALTYTNEGRNFLTANGKDLSSHRPQAVSFGYTVDAVGPMNVDLSNWMADLPALADLPLTQLPIPGSHDSGSYGITRTSDWALTGKDDFGILTELPAFLQNLIVKPIAAAWGRTQQSNLYDQFSDGIRYVDLRLSNEPDGQIYLEHGLRGPNVDTVIADIAAFADAHPREALIVYVQGLKNFTPEAHAEVVGRMQAAFGDRMAPRSIGTSATLSDLWAIDKNVIVVYNNSTVVAADPNLWPDDTLWRPWPNYQSVQRLLGANEQNLADRPAGSIWGMFGEPTPDTTSIATGVLTVGPRSNKEFMWNVHAPVQQWMRVNFKNSTNLVTTDWYQVFWPAGSTFARDGIGAVYETLGSRLSTTTV